MISRDRQDIVNLPRMSSSHSPRPIDKNSHKHKRTPSPILLKKEKKRRNTANFKSRVESDVNGIYRAPIQAGIVAATALNNDNPDANFALQAGTAGSGFASFFLGLGLSKLFKRFFPDQQGVNPVYRTAKTLASLGQAIGTLIGSLVPTQLGQKIAVGILAPLFSFVFGLATPIVWLVKKQFKQPFIHPKKQPTEPTDLQKKGNNKYKPESYLIANNKLFYVQSDKSLLEIELKESDDENPGQYKNNEIGKALKAYLSTSSPKKIKKEGRKLLELADEERSLFKTNHEGWSKYLKTALVLGTSIGVIVGIILTLTTPLFVSVGAATAIAGAIGGIASVVITAIAVPLINKIRKSGATTTGPLNKDAFRNNYPRAGITVGSALGAILGFILGTFVFPGVGSMTGLALGAAIGSIVGGATLTLLGEKISNYVNTNWRSGLNKETDNSWDYAIRTTAFLFGFLGTLIGVLAMPAAGVGAAAFMGVAFVGAALGSAIGSLMGALIGLIVVKVSRLCSVENGKLVEKKADELPWSQRVCVGAMKGSLLGTGIGFLIGLLIGGPAGAITGAIIGNSIGGFAGGCISALDDSSSLQVWKNLFAKIGEWFSPSPPAPTSNRPAASPNPHPTFTRELQCQGDRLIVPTKISDLSDQPVTPSHSRFFQPKPKHSSGAAPTFQPQRTLNITLSS